MSMFSPLHFVVIAIGATLGAWLRWALGVWLNQHANQLPWGTLAANLLGGYLVGLVVGVIAAHPHWPPFWRFMVVTGFLGGLTTFSTFSSETVALIEEGRLAMAVGYAGISLLGSLGLTFLGLLTAQSFR